MKKGFVIIGLMLFIGVTLVGGLDPAPALADAVWIEGKVTDRRTIDRFHRIQLDGKKTYTLMKECKIYLRTQDRPGAFNERPVDFGYVSKGQKVLMKVEDYRAFQVVIER